MYRILVIETGEYLYYNPTWANLLLISVEELSRYKSTPFIPFEMAVKEEMERVFEPTFRGNTQAVQLNGKTIHLFTNKLAFEIIDIGEKDV